MSHQSSRQTGQGRGMLFRTTAVVEKLIIHIGKMVSWLNLLLVLVILIPVVSRYVFSFSWVALEELQWHLYSVGIMIGLSYALTTNTHVRLDLLQNRFKDSTKAWIDILGLIILVLPWCYIGFSHGVDYVQASWRVQETSASPSGLGAYYIIKSVIPLSFFLLFIASVTRILRLAICLTNGNKGEPNGS